VTRLAGKFRRADAFLGLTGGLGKGASSVPPPYAAPGLEQVAHGSWHFIAFSPL